MQLKKKTYTYATAILIALSVIAIVLFFKGTQPKIAVIDMKRVIEIPSERLSRSKLTKDEQERVMKLFATHLPKVIKDYGKAHHLLIVSAPILVSQKNLDITNLMIHETVTRIKKDA